GQREHIPVLARAAVGAGVSGVFMETHPKPDEALCDGPNSWPLALMPELLETLAELDRVVRKNGFVERKGGTWGRSSRSGPGKSSIRGAIRPSKRTCCWNRVPWGAPRCLRGPRPAVARPSSCATGTPDATAARAC